MNEHGQGTPVLTDREARQAKRTGLYRVLFSSLVLAAIAGGGLAIYYWTLG